MTTYLQNEDNILLLNKILEKPLAINKSFNIRAFAETPEVILHLFRGDGNTSPSIFFVKELHVIPHVVHNAGQQATEKK